MRRPILVVLLCLVCTSLFAQIGIGLRTSLFDTQIEVSADWENYGLIAGAGLPVQLIEEPAYFDHDFEDNMELIENVLIGRLETYVTIFRTPTFCLDIGCQAQGTYTWDQESWASCIGFGPQARLLYEAADMMYWYLEFANPLYGVTAFGNDSELISLSEDQQLFYGIGSICCAGLIIRFW